MTMSSGLIIIDGQGETEVTVSKRGRDNHVIREVERVLGRKSFYLRGNKQGGLNVVDLASGRRIGVVYWVN